MYILLIPLFLFFTPLSSAADVTVIPVKLFVPKAIHLTLDDLPPPYHTMSPPRPPIVAPVPANASLLVPDLNFRVTVYREKMKAPRQMIYTPVGDVLVTEMQGNRIAILTADQTSVFADQSNGISKAFGMAFTKGWFYVANGDNLRRYRYRKSDKRLHGTGEILFAYQSSHHWTRSLILSPNHDYLYLTVGSGSNVDAEYPPRASIQIVKIDGSSSQTFACGLRYPVGIDFHPITGDLYVTVQEREGLGDDLVPDFFTKVEKDDFYGWPFAYLSSKNLDPRRLFLNGSSERTDLVERTRTPDVLFQAHSSVLGMQFYRGQQFPSYYQNGAFAAFHGSWNRKMGVGFSLIFIPFDQTYRPKGYYEEFLKGFLLDSKNPTAFGRPVGILEMKDGSLLISEDGNGRLYRLEYVNEKSKVMPIISKGTTVRFDWTVFFLLNTFTFFSLHKH